MKKTEIFLSQSVCFAIETVRAALRHTRDIRLEGLWTQMDMTTDVIGDEKSGVRFITILFFLHPNTRVHANCHVSCVNGEWTSSDTDIWLPDDSGQQQRKVHWKFHCQLNADGQLEVTNNE